jgi:ATP-dependent Lhr-like helicase
VAGLGAAQFAQAGALDRLRAVRDTGDELGPRRVLLLAAADPANPYGAALAWPRRSDTDRRPFQRAAGAYVGLVEGEAVFYLERGGRSLQSFQAADDPATAGLALGAFGALLADRRMRELVITKVDGAPIGDSPWRERLLEAGFQPGYRGLVLSGPYHRN